MIELSILVWLCAAFFAYMGALRGWAKEVISTAGIILGLFALFQFDTLIRQSLFASLAPEWKFYLQTIIFLVIVFFAYQTRALIGVEARNRSRDARDPLQARVLGGIAGFVNGYLIGGSIWYFLDINRIAGGQYPLSPYIIAPPAGTNSAAFVQNLPLYLLTQNGASNDFLALSVVVLFIIVLIII